jgi:pimeloyl-ACP methyl ester carboxylesterase
VSSTTLFTRTLGESGPRLVFCHGLFGQGRNWTQIAKAFADDHRVTLVDLPDHGRSPWTNHFSYVEMAEELAGALTGDDPVALVGHSMGGKTAMLTALAHPELVERLCVVDVAPVEYSAASDFERYVAAMRGLDLAALSSREDADLAMTEAAPNPVVRSFLLQNLRREHDGWRWQMNLEVLGDGLGDLRGWPAGAADELPAYEGPVLWVAGRDSPYIRDEHAPTMERHFPKVRRVTVKGAGHWVHSEQPAVFIEVLRRFLAG